jgi:predicted DNA-binding protein
MQTTVNLSEDAYQYVSSIAQMTERTIDEVIEETFENRFEKEVEILKKSIEISSDEEVLALANLQMPEKLSERLSNLLAENGTGNLNGSQRAELNSLMQVNRFHDLRKAIGIVEAVKRDLIKSAQELP